MSVEPIVYSPNPCSEIPMLAVALADLDRLPTLMKSNLLAGRLRQDIVAVGQNLVEEVPAVVFSCELLEAATVCDILRSFNKKNGDKPTRVYVYKAAWSKVVDTVSLTKMVNGKVSLNLDVFPERSLAKKDTTAQIDMSSHIAKQIKAAPTVIKLFGNKSGDSPDAGPLSPKVEESSRTSTREYTRVYSRDKLQEEYKIVYAEIETASDQARKIEEERDKTKRATKKWDILDARYQKLQDTYLQLHQNAEPLRKQVRIAELEYLIEQGDESQSIAAGVLLADELKQPSKKNDAWKSVSIIAENKLREMGVTDPEEIRTVSGDATNMLMSCPHSKTMDSQLEVSLRVNRERVSRIKDNDELTAMILPADVLTKFLRELGQNEYDPERRQQILQEAREIERQEKNRREEAEKQQQMRDEDLSSTQWRLDSVSVKFSDGGKPPWREKKNVPIEILGGFAIHPEVLWAGGRGKLGHKWVVSHVTTGYKILAVTSKDHAKRICSILQIYKEEFKSSSGKEIKARLPKEIYDWIIRCGKEERLVDLTLDNENDLVSAQIVSTQEEQVCTHDLCTHQIKEVPGE